MNPAFLAPLMLAGAALLVAPYLIHRIRRPEREPVRFSSLLFIPDVKKEVIERRRLQHILLMLTRMAILLLLALAFARPFAKAAAVPQEMSESSKHVILLDTSLSMAADGRLDEAVRVAENILGGLRSTDEVAVVAFARTAEVLSPLSAEAGGGTVAAARAAIGTARLREESTDYGAALREAQRLLLGEAASIQDGTRRVIHVISDLQRSGMPGPSETWKLSSAIELEAIGVGGGPVPNFAIADAVARRTLGKDIRIVGKVKNWSANDADAVPLTLVIDGRRIESIEKPVRAGNATQFSFAAPIPESGVLSGYLELPKDEIEQDNRRYFVWSPPAKHEVAIVAGSSPIDTTDPKSWPASWFIQRGLPTGGEWPFESKSISMDVYGQSGADRAAAVVLPSMTDTTPEALNRVLDLVSRGGAALVLLDQANDASRAFADALGLEIRGPRFENPKESQYELLTWVALDHSVFAGFQGHLYNDFSTLRFHQYLEIAEPATESAQVLARFESGAPAMLEVMHGEGTLTIWTFAASLPATNLPKSSRFVPLLYETMRHLCRVEESESTWHVGDVLRERDLMFDENGRGLVQWAGEPARELAKGDVMRLDRRGLLTVRAAGFVDGSGRVEAVNVAAEESDLSAMDSSEFLMKLAASPRLFEESSTAAADAIQDASIAQEYGLLFMALVVAFLLFESWYMARLTAQRKGGERAGVSS